MPLFSKDARSATPETPKLDEHFKHIAFIMIYTVLNMQINLILIFCLVLRSILQMGRRYCCME